MLNIRETIKNIDLKSAGIGACVVLATEVAIYGTIKGVKAASKFVRSAVETAREAKNEGLSELHLVRNNEEKKS